MEYRTHKQEICKYPRKKKTPQKQKATGVHEAASTPKMISVRNK